MVTRLLNLAGLYLGEAADMMPAHESNPEGHWEHLPIVNLNERLLALFDADWHHPPILPPGWLDLPRVQTLATEARQLVDRYFSHASEWGWKDPRTTSVIPFWQQVVPGLRFVVCVRNPLDVAASLRARDNMSSEHALALWHHYTQLALHVQPDQRLLAPYELFFTDFTGASQRLLHWTDLAPCHDAILTALRCFVRPDLKHHGHTLHDVEQDSDVPDGVKHLYATLHLAAETSNPAV